VICLKFSMNRIRLWCDMTELNTKLSCRNALVYCCLLLLIAGCARAPRIERLPVREGPDLPRYESLDIAALHGKKIVIDPGHGGTFTGAIGFNGLREADANLSTALHLQELLRDAGAEVILTRSTDSTVAKGENPTLIEDLEARPAIANELDADLFISVHHNADIFPDSQRNDVEVYYKMVDPGQSMDVARHILRSMALADLSASRQKLLLPGNYRVLRLCDMPAVLIEASYMTNTDNAMKLLLARTHRMQASAIFRGLVSYFSSGVPEAAFLSPSDETMDVAAPLIVAELKPVVGAVDFTSIRMALDNVVVAHEYDPEKNRVVYLHPTPLPNGKHEVTVQFKNLAGNSSEVATKTFRIARPPAVVSLGAYPAVLPPNKKARAVLTASVMDRFWMPVADGTRVDFAGNAGWVRPESGETVNGEASCYFVPPENEGKWTMRAECTHLTGFCEVETKKEAVLAVGRVRRGDTRSPIEGAFARFAPEKYVATDTHGMFLLPDVRTKTLALKVARSGYIPVTAEMSIAENIGDWMFNMVPVAEGVLHGAKIAVDAEFGAATGGAVGPTGLRASLVNLATARYLADMLTAAGADVVLVRSEETVVTPLERVERVNSFGAEIYVTIGHGAEDQNLLAVLDEAQTLTTVPLSDVAYVAHYPTSIQGKRLALSIARFVSGLREEADAETFPSVAYTLVQTACPAVAVHVLEPFSVAAESLLAKQSFQRREAYAVYNGILGYYGFPKKAAARLTGQVIGEDVRRPVEGAMVALDDYLFLETMSDGRFAFDPVSAGKHTLLVRTPLGDQVQIEVELEPNQERDIPVLVPGWTPPKESLPFRPALSNAPIQR